MHNKILITFFFFILLNIDDCHAQFINNKINIGLGYSIGHFHGKEYQQDNLLRLPSFYANMHRLNGFSAFGIYSLHKVLDIGINVERLSASDWILYSHKDYQGAGAELLFWSPLIQLHSPFKELGIWNKISFFITAAPNFGYSSISLSNKLSEIEYEGIKIFEQQLSADAGFYGVTAGMGAAVNFSQDFGFRIEYALSHAKTSAGLNLDDSFTYSKFSLGLYKRLWKNKKYYY